MFRDEASALRRRGDDVPLLADFFVSRLAERLKGQPMIAPGDIAEMVVFLLRQPENLDLSEVIVRRFNGGTGTK